MHLKISLVFVAVFLLLNCTKHEKPKTATLKSEISSLYMDLEGNDVSIEDYKGKKVLLNFWATWCTPCLKEMPSMARAQDTLTKENYIFLFATADPLAKITVFKEKNQYPFQFLQYKSTLDKLNIHALPATFIYDTKGNLAKRIDGMTEWDSEDVLIELRAIE